jgi:hypothetical protein
VTIRNRGIIADIDTKSGRSFSIYDSYVESYEVHGWDEDGTPQRYMLRYGDKMTLRKAEAEMQRPHGHAGQRVRLNASGREGITLSRSLIQGRDSSSVLVQFEGDASAVLVSPDSLTVIMTSHA